MIADIRRVIDDDQHPLPDPAHRMEAAIRARHGAAVRALIFYGSARREGEQAGKMLDFYVIVESYRAVFGRGLACLGAYLLPPSVHFLEIRGADGQRLRSKYAIMSERAFIRRTRGGSFESMLWARFSQPATVVTEDAALRARLLDTLAMACAHFARQVTPLLSGAVGAYGLWERGLAESYRTELRPEKSGTRSREIVARFPERYARLSALLLPAGADGAPYLPDAGVAPRLACRGRWFARRLLGKPMGAMRVLKAATTFDAGLDYILEKIESHSGVRLEVSARERRHPVLYAPLLAWRLFRTGAMR